MEIKFLQDCDLVVIGSYNEQDDSTEQYSKSFKKGDFVDVDVLTHRQDSTDWQFADGSCAYAVPNKLFQCVGETFLNEIVKTIEDNGFIRINGHLATIVNSDKWKCDPENEIIYFGWEEEGQEYSEKLTEEDFDNIFIEDGDIVIKSDEEDKIRISLYRKYELKN